MLINYMDAQRFNIQVATVIGGNKRIIRRKDMEPRSRLVERDTSGNGWRVTCTAMEYTDITVEEYTMDNRNKIREMAMDTTGGQVGTNTMDSSKMIWWMERESNKSKANCTQSNTKKTSLSVRVKYRRLLENDLV
jgi:hypothetical protein